MPQTIHYKCPVEGCPRTFPTVEAVRRHKRRDHGAHPGRPA